MNTAKKISFETLEEVAVVETVEGSDEETVEVVETVGEVLREKRQELGYSIDQVFEHTKIRTIFIELLEQNNFDELPGTVYVIGFIRTYASFLKIAPDYLVALYLSNAQLLDNKVEHKIYLPVKSKKFINIKNTLISFSLVILAIFLWKTYENSIKLRNGTTPQVTWESLSLPDFAEDELLNHEDDINASEPLDPGDAEQAPVRTATVASAPVTSTPEVAATLPSTPTDVSATVATVPVATATATDAPDLKIKNTAETIPTIVLGGSKNKLNASVDITVKDNFAGTVKAPIAKILTAPVLSKAG